MNMFIKVVDGQPVDHPAVEENLIKAFGHVPEDWEPFLRVVQPDLGVYKVFDPATPSYEKVNGVWTDVWFIRDMTPEEVAKRQQETKDEWDFFHPQKENWTAWGFDVATCRMVPPVPRPTNTNGVPYDWCGADNAWKAVPAYPVDGVQYRFDYIAWQWVVDVN